MKQIKTIMREIKLPEIFDKEVNAAIAEGWTLVKREVLQAYDAPARIHFGLLYAELEREFVKQVPHDCQTCAHVDKHVGLPPCDNCHSADKWETET